MIDTATTVAIAAADRKNRSNVSSDLSVSFMNAAPVGEDIFILSEVTKIGKRLAFTQCDLFNQQEILLLSGRHTKAFIEGSFDLDKKEWTVNGA